MKIPSSCWSTALISFEGRIRDIPRSDGNYVVEADKAQPAGEEVRVRTVSLRFNQEELSALNNFFNGTGEMADEIYDPLARKFRVAAARIGLWDEVYGVEL